MDAHEYVFFFQNLNLLCIFSDRFFALVFFPFRFFGSTGSMTSPVLVTLAITLRGFSKYYAQYDLLSEFN
jgi:hypothetical protein